MGSLGRQQARAERKTSGADSRTELGIGLQKRKKPAEQRAARESSKRRGGGTLRRWAGWRRRFSYAEIKIWRKLGETKEDRNTKHF